MTLNEVQKSKKEPASIMNAKAKNRQARQCLSIFIYLKNQSYATTFLLFRPKQDLVDYRACGANLFKYLNLSAMGEFKFFLHDSYMILFRLFINSRGNEKRSRLRCCPASDPILGTTKKGQQKGA